MLDKEEKHNNNELEHLKTVYQGKIHMYNAADSELINKIISGALQFDRPDIYSIVDNDVYAFEHFEFDYYKNNRHGSSYEIEQSREENEFIQHYLQSEDVSETRRIESIASASSFISNFIYFFNDHYGKIDSYIARIEQKTGTSNIHMWFIAEIICPMQCVAQTENGVELVHPLMFKKVYDTVKRLDKIDGIVFVNDNSFLAIPRKDYEIANRNYGLDSIKFELINPMQFRSLHTL